MASEHIDLLELMAVFLILKHFQAQVIGTAMETQTDTTTVVAYIIHQGDTFYRSLCRLTTQL